MDEFSLIICGIVILFLLICFTISLLLYYTGILQSVDVGAGSPPIGGVVLAYKFVQGPYKYAGDCYNEITRIAPEYKCLGVYYDDPNKIPAEKCRYIVGAILGDDTVKIEKETEDKLIKEGLKIIHLPDVTNCVKASFPYVNTLSIFIAVWKVYPAMGRYIEDHKLCAYPFLEIYEKDVIHFMAPLAKQDEFFAPEAHECVPEEYKKDSMAESFDETASFSDESRDTSLSRSVSAYSRAIDHEELDDSDVDNEHVSDSEVDDSEVQDSEISSSFDVRASTAKTNLLDESTTSDEIPDVSAVLPDKLDHSAVSPNDSGICSGRTSAAPTDLSMSSDTKNISEASGRDSNDSSSSFEELHMDESLNIPKSTEAGK